MVSRGWGLARTQQPRILTQRFLAAIAGGADKSVIDVFNPGGQIGNDHRIGALLDRQRQLANFGGSGFFGSNVAPDSNQIVAVVLTNGADVDFDIDQAAVLLAPVAVFKVGGAGGENLAGNGGQLLRVHRGLGIDQGQRQHFFAGVAEHLATGGIGGNVMQCRGIHQFNGVGGVFKHRIDQRLRIAPGGLGAATINDSVVEGENSQRQMMQNAVRVAGDAAHFVEYRSIEIFDSQRLHGDGQAGQPPRQIAGDRQPEQQDRDDCHSAKNGDPERIAFKRLELGCGVAGGSGGYDPDPVVIGFRQDGRDNALDVAHLLFNDGAVLLLETVKGGDIDHDCDQRNQRYRQKEDQQVEGNPAGTERHERHTWLRLKLRLLRVQGRRSARRCRQTGPCRPDRHRRFRDRSGCPGRRR